MEQFIDILWYKCIETLQYSQVNITNLAHSNWKAIIDLVKIGTKFLEIGRPQEIWILFYLICYLFNSILYSQSIFQV